MGAIARLLQEPFFAFVSICLNLHIKERGELMSEQNLIEIHNLVNATAIKWLLRMSAWRSMQASIRFPRSNGAGKTTTIKVVVGLLQPARHGEGSRLRCADPALMAKASSGYVPDTPNLYAKLTGRELLRFVGDLYNLDRPGSPNARMSCCVCLT